MPINNGLITNRAEDENFKIQVQIVTFNSEDVIEKCLLSIFEQTIQINKIVVIDNNSSDNTKKILSSLNDRIVIIENKTNSGYAGGHNIGIRHAISDGIAYVVTLNPDTVINREYIQETVKFLDRENSYGGITGKLVRPFENGIPQLTDSTGLQMESFYHVRDRDFGKTVLDSVDAEGSVWGICGAAAVYRTRMLLDIEFNGQFFDESFFIYKEDVDLCWRANRAGWNFYYQPFALAVHNRSWRKGSRPSTAAQSHSFANQIALLIAHVPRLTPYLILTIIIEAIRWLIIFLRCPKAALKACKLINQNWSLMWSKRQLLSRNHKGATTS